MRKLVTVRRITDIKPIEGADKIEEVMVDGWGVVAQKGIHSKGDLILYFEVDSFLPESDQRFESFMKFGTRTFDGITGHRVRTVRLRGTYSQGIIMPISEFPEIVDAQLDTDYSEIVGVVKWEKPEVVGGCGQQKGTFPWFLQKSDQERIQNLYNKIRGSEDTYVGTLKMDGSSVTVFYTNSEEFGLDTLGYCSRNQELKLSEEGETPSRFEVGVLNSDLFNKVKKLYEITGKEMAIQGELVGEGIQGNFEKMDTHQVFAYNIFDIKSRQYPP